MTTVWIVESSKTVRRMVEIALTGLPLDLVFTSQVSKLIGQGRGAPSLLICAQRVGDSGPEEYQAQVNLLAKAGYHCPLVLLLDQKSESISRVSSLPLVGGLRKPFKTQKLIEIVARSLNIEVPHAEIFDESRRVIPLARASQPRGSDQPIKAQAGEILPTQSTEASVSKVHTPGPTSVGSLLDAVTPVQQRPQSSNVSSTEQVTRRPSDSHVDSHHLAATESQVQLLHNDLSPFPTTSKSDSSHRQLPHVNPAVVESTPASHLPVPEVHPRGDELSDTQDFEKESRDHRSNVIPKSTLPSDINQSNIEPTIDAQQSSDQSDLGGDWLDQHKSSQSSKTEDDQHETAVDLVPIKSTELSTPTEVSDTTSEVIAVAQETVRVTTERTLAIVQRVSRQHAGRLTPNEVRVLIERVAWEVVPAIATELIQEEIKRSVAHQANS